VEEDYPNIGDTVISKNDYEDVIYGQLIVLGHSSYFRQGGLVIPKGPTNQVFTLKQKLVANGVRE
jgi:hypothetical protein